jgi:uncharacterized protein (DUF433 family)
MTQRSVGENPGFAGPRITVRAIVESIRLYHAEEPVLRAFPDLTPTALNAALVYYVEHPEEIEQYIREHAMAEHDTTDVPQVLQFSRRDHTLL